MKLSVNIRGLEDRYGIEQAARLVGEAGFDCADRFLNLDRSGSRFLTSDYARVAREDREIIEAQGIRVNQTHAPFRFPVAQWDAPGHFDLFVRSLEISAILGASVCVVHPLHHKLSFAREGHR